MYSCLSATLALLKPLHLSLPIGYHLWVCTESKREFQKSISLFLLPYFGYYQFADESLQSFQLL